MPSFAQMMGILDTGGKQLSQAFQQNKENALKQRQQEEDEKKNAAMLKLTGVQTETAQQGLATEKDKAQAQKDFLAQSEAELAALEKDPTVDPKILAKAKENLKLQRMVSYFNPDKVGDFSINKNDLAQNEEMIGNKLAMAKEELSGKQAETGLRKAQTLTEGSQNAMLKKQTSLLGMPKPADADIKKDLQLSAGEKEKLAGLGEAVRNLQGLREMFKEKKMGNVSASFAGGLSGLPLVGQRIAPEAAAYKTQAKQVAENFLRAATGAAAPDKEVDLYAGFLPQPGDTDELAEQKITSFASRVRDKAKGVADRMRIEGAPDKASILEGNMDSLISSILVKNNPNKQTDRRAQAKAQAGYGASAGGAKLNNPFDMLGGQK